MKENNANAGERKPRRKNNPERAKEKKVREKKPSQLKKAPVRARDRVILPPSAKSEKQAADAVLQTGGKKTARKERRVKNAVKIIFLGGVGEIGKNMTALECGDDIIIIDAGAIFPTEEMPGIDLVVPDLTYLIENKKKKGGFTHELY